MNLDDQKLTGVGELVINDSLNAPLLNLKITRTDTTVIPESNNLIVYVDKVPSLTPSSERKEYVFSLSSVLEINEFFSMKVELNSDVELINSVSRIDNTIESLNNLPVILFEGVNYIYTNYSGVNIELMYLKNNEFNKVYVNNMIYAIRKLKSNGDFSLDDIYFKDAFTTTENGLEVSVNKLETNFIVSKNNKFYLDSDGNLTVNTITTTNQTNVNGSINSILSQVYPIGAIYLSVNNNDPSVLFGGTWSLFGSGRCLVGVDSAQPEFITPEKEGGAKTHALTIDELPAHTHTIDSSGSHKHTYTGYLQCEVSGASNYTAIAHKRYASDGAATPPSMNSTGSHTHTVNETGSSVEHNNLQPYITCYMWKRVS